MEPRFIDYQTVEASLDLLALARALEAGHRLPKAEISSTYLERNGNTVISLWAWIDKIGIAVKTPTIFPTNVGLGLSSVNGGFCLYSAQTGVLLAHIDFHAITKWKTAADSLLASLKLAPKSSKNIVIVGAGTVARSMFEAYQAGFPGAHINVWNRTLKRAEELAVDYPEVTMVDELERSVRCADITCCATMSTEPLLRGAWLRPGQHVDLFGFYLPHMREADDEAILRSKVYVDSRK
ncbi:ornithine cyclodeaminase family protein [Ruegeria atlantica]|uniref:ornithine cyclodeaminase family protein n=1 Tax=Ruegeria atlantica TaxID=81569 RepID=UPI0034A0AB39